MSVLPNSSEVPAYIVDAFTGELFRGNPAAVVVLTHPASELWMQQVAAEFNLAETAFLVPEASGRWQLRWFTPTTEVPLCGHATLASAHVLWNELGHRQEALIFTTRSGELTAARRNGTIALDFPAASVSVSSLEKTVIEALGVSPVEIAVTAQDLLIEVDSVREVRLYQPDMQVIEALPWRALMLTARNNGGADAHVDFVSRFFAPSIGIPEDPVTGAMHCALVPYWAERLGKTHMIAEQCSTRGGLLHLENAAPRVVLAGEATTFLRGVLQAC
ncbi:MAG: PhzF family phenazine biosynthesis protein [Gammaproteobacteria bacterium]|nr:PhzF family phenazine biosynthesis protein [Gammaproteobacteria bacterium]MDP2140400.1 PhzF family phenazine biosynthesis protein [Gammaproteobacteria bacterium]MDP2349439.1 PhzF family phenazine biosynthesis protein [Gammaproteobacteria bacterium]